MLINPLRRERNEGAAEPEASPLPPPAAVRAEREAESTEETREVEDALPVWLL